MRKIKVMEMSNQHSAEMVLMQHVLWMEAEARKIIRDRV